MFLQFSYFVKVILHLTQLNKNIEHHYFKVETINIILNTKLKDYLMASIDLKDENYTVKMFENFQRYSKFESLDKLYKFVCFLNSLASCPRTFSKIKNAAIIDLILRNVVASRYIPWK